MGRRISMATREELMRAVRERYKGARRREKTGILDEFVAVTGYHRKHAVRLLNDEPAPEGAGARPGPRVYDEAVRAAQGVGGSQKARDSGGLRRTKQGIQQHHRRARGPARGRGTTAS